MTTKMVEKSAGIIIKHSLTADNNTKLNGIQICAGFSHFVNFKIPF